MSDPLHYLFNSYMFYLNIPDNSLPPEIPDLNTLEDPSQGGSIFLSHVYIMQQEKDT